MNWKFSFISVFPVQSPVECLQASKKNTLKYCNVLKHTESERESCSVMSDSFPPYGLYSPWHSPGQNTEWVVLPLSRGSCQQRDQIQVSSMQADSLPAEPTEKPKNTGVGSLSLLQGIFPTQEMNPGLLHCRRILYQLSYQGIRIMFSKLWPYIY